MDRLVVTDSTTAALLQIATGVPDWGDSVGATNSRGFSWTTFFLGALSGVLATVVTGMMVVIVLLAAVTAIGTNAETTFDQIASELEAGASFDDFAALDEASE